MRKETDLAFQALKKRLALLELMTDTMKWISDIADENDELKKNLGDHDLTRIQLMETEREREDLKLLSESLTERLGTWEKSTMDLADILLSVEKKGYKFTKPQRAKIAKVLQEKYKND